MWKSCWSFLRNGLAWMDSCLRSEPHVFHAVLKQNNKRRGYTLWFHQTWRAGKWMIFLARNLHVYGSFQPCLMKPEGKPKLMIPGWWTSKFLTLRGTGSTWTQRRCENVHRACTPPGPASSETSRRRRAVPSTGQPRRCWGYWGYHGIFFPSGDGITQPKTMENHVFF